MVDLMQQILYNNTDAKNGGIIVAAWLCIWCGGFDVEYDMWKIESLFQYCYCAYDVVAVI